MDMLKKEAVLFPVKDAWKFYQQSVTVDPGASEYRAPNPPYGAIFTYYLEEAPKSLKAMRKESEKDLIKQQEDIPFPGWDAVEKEKLEDSPYLLFTITDGEGNVVNHVRNKPKKGINRVHWDLDYASGTPLSEADTAQSAWRRGGYQVTEGKYLVSMYVVQNGDARELAGPREFQVKKLKEGALEPVPEGTYLSFKKELEDAMLEYRTATTMLSKLRDRVQVMKNACFLLDKDVAPGLIEKVYALEAQVGEINTRMTGYTTKEEIGEKQHNNPSTRFTVARRGMSTSYGPTEMHRESLKTGLAELEPLKAEISRLYRDRVPALEKELEEAGAKFIRVD
jgi:hypothetical protein